MQIATSLNVVAHDPSAGVVRDGADAGGVDLQGGDGAAFGDLLSHQLRTNGSRNDTQAPDGETPGVVAEHVASDAMPLKWGPTAGPANSQATGRVAAADDGAPTSADATDGANTDLAAQLAFVVQWAALGNPPDRSNVPSDAGASGTTPDPADAIDRGAKLAVVHASVGEDRGAVSSVAAALASPTTAADGPGVDPAAAAAAAAALRARSVDGAERPASTVGSQLPLFGDFVRTALPRRDDRTSPATAPDSLSGSDPLQTTTASTAQPELRDASSGSSFLADASIGTAAAANTALFAQPNASAIASTAGHAAAQVASLATQAGSLADRLNEPVGTSAWSHEVGHAALRIAAGDLQSASLRLNPEHLGPLDVQVRIDQGVAHVAFHAAHADTRQALEASRATLDQLFQGQGLRTGDVSIASSTDGADAARTNPEGTSADASRRDGSATRRDAADTRDDALAANVGVRVRRALGLVDTFA